jgi:hypothetical protein
MGKRQVFTMIGGLAASRVTTSKKLMQSWGVD